MRIWTRVSTNSTLLFAAAILASATAVPCGAGGISRSAAETGLPPYLVNRPTCGIDELSDEDCRRWPRARSQPFDQ